MKFLSNRIEQLKSKKFVKAILDFDTKWFSKNSEYHVEPTFYRHEALDRSSVISEFLYNHLVEHKYYTSGINPEYNKNVDLAFDYLCKAYQAVGNEDNEVLDHIVENS